jgi:hypothetical protein
MFNPPEHPLAGRGANPPPRHWPASRDGTLRELINGAGRPDIESSVKASTSGRGNVSGDTDWTSGICASPRWKCGTATSAHMTRLLLVSTVLAVTPLTSRGTLKNANRALI